MKYMIHAHPKRIDYVNDHLVPSLIKQGIRDDDIVIFLDSNNRGNLQAFLDSLDFIKNSELDNEKGIWHLQDDVIVCHDFKDVTEKYSNDFVINGFVSNNYNKSKLNDTMFQKVNKSWLSFPCVYIPNHYIAEFMIWLYENKDKDNVMEYKRRYESNRHDDFFFYEFLRKKHKNDYVLNLAPNLVDHIDFLIGSSINKPRKEQVRGYYFMDLELVRKLEKALNK